MAPTDIFDLDTYYFDFTGLGTDALNFGNIDAAGIVSLIGRLGDELDNLRDSGFFDKIDIPLSRRRGRSRSLGFADVVTSGLFYDKGNDGEKDGANRLASDLNAALAAAGLDTAIVVQGDGTKLTFQIIDPSITEFKITLGAGDLGGFGQLVLAPVADGMPADGFAKSYTATPPAGADGFAGVISQDAKLLFSFDPASGKESVLVTLTAASTADNTPVPMVHSGIGDDTIKLVRGDNSATFATVQSMVFRLNTILGLGSAVAYDSATDALTINLGALLPRFEVDEDFALKLDLDDFPLLGFHSDTTVNVHAEVGFAEGFTIGVYLGDTVPGALANLSDGTGTPATQLAVLNDGQGAEIKIEQALTAPSPVISSIQLSGDARFEISLFDGVGGVAVVASADGTSLDAGPLVSFTGRAFIGDTVFNLTDGSSAKVTSAGVGHVLNMTPLTGGADNRWDLGDSFRVAHLVVVPKAGNDPLIDKINDAIDLLDALDGLDVVADGNRLRLQATSFLFEGFHLKAEQADPAVKDLGFGTFQESTGPLVGDSLDTFVLTGGDAHFTLTIGTDSYAVTVPLAATVGNTDLNDLAGNPTTLVADVNAALLAALPASLDGKIVADSSGNSLVLRIAHESITEVGFSAAIDDPAVLELGTDR